MNMFFDPVFDDAVELSCMALHLLQRFANVSVSKSVEPTTVRQVKKRQSKSSSSPNSFGFVPVSDTMHGYSVDASAAFCLPCLVI